MKKILVPTDFSEVSLNAVAYAADIAIRIRASILLLNVYNIPVVPTEASVIFSLDEFEKDSISGLTKLQKMLQEKYNGKLTVEWQSKLGYPEEEIIQSVKVENIDLIIMGMQGRGALEEKFIGSTTISVLRKVKCPVLAIDGKVKFKDIKRIVLANDMKEIPDKSILNPLKYIAQSFNSHVFILNVVPENQTIFTVSETTESIKLDDFLEDVDHSFHFVQDNNISGGINEFVNDRFMDMIVMIPRKHSLLWNIFHESNSKRVAFHSAVPLLTLHE